MAEGGEIPPGVETPGPTLSLLQGSEPQGLARPVIGSGAETEGRRSAPPAAATGQSLSGLSRGGRESHIINHRLHLSIA